MWKRHTSRRALLSREDGQALIEYSLILFLCSIVSVAALGLLGMNLAGLFSKIEASIAGVI